MLKDERTLIQSGRLVVVGTCTLVAMILAIASRNAWSNDSRLVTAIPQESVPRISPARQQAEEIPADAQSANGLREPPPQVPSAPPGPVMKARSNSQPRVACTECGSHVCLERTSCDQRHRIRQRQVVERATGIPGMRVTEWRSAATGLTLSESQQFARPLPDSVGCGPCNRPVSHSQIEYSRTPFLNIPDSVW